MTPHTKINLTKHKITYYNKFYTSNFNTKPTNKHLTRKLIKHNTQPNKKTKHQNETKK